MLARIRERTASGGKSVVNSIKNKFRPTKEIERQKSRAGRKVDDSLMDYKLYHMAVSQYLVKTGRPFEHVVKEHRKDSNVPHLRYQNPRKLP